METQDPKSRIVEKATSISRMMALAMVLQYVFAATWMVVTEDKTEPMPWENIVAAITFYAVGQHTKYVLDFIRDIVPWAKTKANDSAN
jgi:hypothetical protein